jgi:hypothetical protein
LTKLINTTDITVYKNILPRDATSTREFILYTFLKIHASEKNKNYLIDKYKYWAA